MMDKIQKPSNTNKNFLSFCMFILTLAVGSLDKGSYMMDSSKCLTYPVSEVSTF
jgi:hypothetical protein